MVTALCTSCNRRRQPAQPRPRFEVRGFPGMRTYPYAVLDATFPPDAPASPDSCHLTLDAAIASARRLNSLDANAQHYVTEWGATRWAQPAPAPEHHPMHTRLGHYPRVGLHWD